MSFLLVVAGRMPRSSAATGVNLKDSGFVFDISLNLGCVFSAFLLYL